MAASTTRGPVGKQPPCAACGRGKRGAFRVIYYVLTDELPIVAIMLYGKNEKGDVTPAERNGLGRIVEALKAELERRRAAAAR